MLTGTSLVVQWIRLYAPNAGGPGSIPGQGTRSHMHAATKTQCNQINKISKMLTVVICFLLPYFCVSVCLGEKNLFFCKKNKSYIKTLNIGNFYIVK